METEVAGYTILWCIWGLMFLAIEGTALFNKRPHDTLSEHVWRLLGIRGYTIPKGWQLRRAVLVMFLAWLVVHLLTAWA